MEKFELWYPAKPYIVNQAWGIKNPIYAQFGFGSHNGVDFRVDADGILNAPCAGTIVRTGNQPSGGGIFLGIMSEEAEFKDGVVCRALIDLLHCKELLVKEGDYVKAGAPIAVADNTGFSTGPHTHMQLRRVKKWNGKTGDKLTWTKVDTNDANHSFDPAPYWNGFYAVDADTVLATLQRIIGLLLKYIKNRG